MYKVNFVLEDEELLEPYEWEEDDCIEELHLLPIYRIHKKTMHDFMYGQLKIDKEDSTFIVCDCHYNLVIEIKNNRIQRRGTLLFDDRNLINQKTKKLPFYFFDYRLIEEAYDKEFGLTRNERMKKICLEQVIDEIFVDHYDLFLEICKKFHIHGENSSEKYLTLKQRIEKGYSSLHDILYKELVQKR